MSEERLVKTRAWLRRRRSVERRQARLISRHHGELLAIPLPFHFFIFISLKDLLELEQKSLLSLLVGMTEGASGLGWVEGGGED
jgi:hypothetical protein